MKLAAIARIRNVETLIPYTLAHVSKFADEIYLYDDCSTDHTVDICRSFPKVKIIIQGEGWASDPRGRNEAEGLRQLPYEMALKNGADWVYCFDADEFADFEGIDFTADAYRMKLFDFYITPEDTRLSWRDRKWMGREYREILMLFKAHHRITFHQRQPTGVSGRVETAGWVKHYGKAISIRDWDRRCDYYVKHRGGSYLPKFRDRWRERKGKAVHTVSDFGTELITWRDRKTKGILLKETMIEKKVADIIIPHHNRHDLLERLLPNISVDDFNVIVPCGGSFAENCNRGARVAKTNTFIFLNDDVEINNKTLLKLAQFPADAVSLGQKIPECPAPVYGLTFYWKDGIIKTRVALTVEETHIPVAFCLKVTRSTWEDLKGFDEGFINGGEDQDFALRLLSEGYNIGIMDDVVNHYHHQSLGRFDHDQENADYLRQKWPDTKIKNLFKL